MMEPIWECLGGLGSVCMDMVLPRLIGRFPKTHKIIPDRLEPSIAAEAFLRFMSSVVSSPYYGDIVLLSRKDSATQSPP